MAARALVMSKQEEIRRLRGLGLKKKAVARALRCSVNTVKRYWDPEHSPGPSKTTPPTFPIWTEKVGWSHVAAELSRGVPVNVLWEELCNSGQVTVQYPCVLETAQTVFPFLTPPNPTPALNTSPPA